MTSQSLSESLTAAEKAVWDAAEKGEAGGGKPQLKAEAVTGEEGVRLRLFEILAHQNGGDSRGAYAAIGGLPGTATGALGVWRRAERVFAARKLQMDIDVVLTPDDASSLERGSLLDKLIAARAYLALGLAAIQQNRSTEADALLNNARDLFSAVGSNAGRAVVETELGKLRAWQGRSEEAILNLTTALNIWGAASTDKSADVWHELGALLLDSRRYKQAIDILQRVQDTRPTNRTRNALTRALIADDQLEAALVQAQAVLKAESDGRKAAAASNQPKPNPYREAMALRDIGEIAVREALNATRPAREAVAVAKKGGNAETIRKAEAGLAAVVATVQPQVARAEQALQEGAALLNFQRTDQNPVFPKWTRQIDGGPQISLAGDAQKDDQEFEKLRLVQLELMIDSFAKPEGAGRNLAKLAESFSRRLEVIQELETREQAAAAFVLADNMPAAARQLEMAHRLAVSRGLSYTARSLRERLAKAVAAGARAGLAAPGVIPIGIAETSKFCTVVAALDEDTGRRVWIHQYRIPSLSDEKRKTIEAALGNLEKLNEQHRVLIGLPEVLKISRLKGGSELSFDLVTEDVGGEPMEEAMKAPLADVKRPIRVIRSLAATIGALHKLGSKDCRPTADRVLLDLGDAPIWTDILPVHEGPVLDEDVKRLAALLVEWLGGGPGERSRLLWKGGKNGGPFKASVFPPGKTSDSVPPGLEALLSAILLGKGERPKSPSALADELEKYC